MEIYQLKLLQEKYKYDNVFFEKMLSLDSPDSFRSRFEFVSNAVDALLKNINPPKLDEIDDGTCWQSLINYINKLQNDHVLKNGRIIINAISFAHVKNMNKLLSLLIYSDHYKSNIGRGNDFYIGSCFDVILSVDNEDFESALKMIEQTNNAIAQSFKYNDIKLVDVFSIVEFLDFAKEICLERIHK